MEMYIISDAREQGALEAVIYKRDWAENKIKGKKINKVLMLISQKDWLINMDVHMH